MGLRNSIAMLGRNLEEAATARRNAEEHAEESMQSAAKADASRQACEEALQAARLEAERLQGEATALADEVAGLRSALAGQTDSAEELRKRVEAGDAETRRALEALAA